MLYDVHTQTLTAVEAKETFMFQHFRKAVDAVLVHNFAGVGATLILHAGLDQVNGIDSCGSSG